MDHTYLDSPCTLEDYDFLGGDLWKTKARDAEECQMECDKYNVCKKWTFYDSKSDGKCYLKKINGTIQMQRCYQCMTGFGSDVNKQCGNDS